MAVTHWDGYYKLATFFQIVNGNGSVVKFYKRTSKVQTNASTYVAVVDRCRCLIETVEYLVYLVFGYALAIIIYCYCCRFGVMCKTYAYFATSRGIFEGV